MVVSRGEFRRPMAVDRGSNRVADLRIGGKVFDPSFGKGTNMKPFGMRYLEPVLSDGIVPVKDWSWTPSSGAIARVYASGNSTRSRESTYAAEKDNRVDEDRPNEGLAA